MFNIYELIAEIDDAKLKCYGYLQKGKIQASYARTKESRDLGCQAIAITG